jgi:hypothetical protein
LPEIISQSTADLELADVVASLFLSAPYMLITTDAFMKMLSIQPVALL